MIEERDLSKKITNATKWSVITNVVRKLISPITNMILARLLIPEVFGVVATINMVISFSEIFSDAGFQKYIVQHEFDTEEDLYKSANVAFWTNFIIAMILWSGIAIFNEPISNLVGSHGYGIQLTVAALTIPLFSFSSIQQSIYKRRFEFKAMFIPRLINCLIPIIITIPLAYITRNSWALIIGTVASNLSDAILFTIKSKWKPKFCYQFKLLKEMFSFSIWTLFEQLSIWLTINVDVFILGNIISTHELGLYKTSITTVNQITTLITTTIIPVLFSALSRCQKDERMFKSTLYQFQNKTAILLLPMSVGILIYKEMVTWILLGKNWMEASLFIGLIGLMQAFTILICNFGSEVYRAKGNPKISFLVQILYILCIIPTLIVASKYSFNVLCIARTICMAAFIVINLVTLKLKYKFSIKLMIKSIYEPFIATGIMTIVGIILKYIIKSVELQLISIFVCIIVYFLSCMLFKGTRESIQKFYQSIKFNIKKSKIKVVV